MVRSAAQGGSSSLLPGTAGLCLPSPLCPCVWVWAHLSLPVPVELEVSVRSFVILSCLFVIFFMFALPTCTPLVCNALPRKPELLDPLELELWL